MLKWRDAKPSTMVMQIIISQVRRVFSMDKYSKLPKSAGYVLFLPLGGCREGFCKATKPTPANAKSNAPPPRRGTKLHQQKKRLSGAFVYRGILY